MVTNGETTSVLSVEYIAIADIDPSVTNRHCADDDPDVIELAQTIRENGLLAPISVRPKTENRFEIICGERRWRAFRVNQQDEIPCFVKTLDDTQAQIERIVENYQRRDPTFLEQGEAVAALMELTNSDVSEIANRLGQSVSWVRRRSRLPNLITEWKAELEKPDTAYGKIRDSVNKLEEVASLPANTQKILLEQNVLRYIGTVKEMRKAISKYFMNLDEKPWSRTWEKKAFSGSGKKRCDACYRRSDRDNVLFDNPDMACSGDRMCLDPECWNNKCLLWSKHLLNSNPGMVPITRGYGYGGEAKKLADYFGVEPVAAWDWKKRAEDEGEDETGMRVAATGVFVDGPDIGTVENIWLPAPEPDNGEDEDEDSDADDNSYAVHGWRESQTATHQTRGAFGELVKQEITAYLNEIHTYATVPTAELTSRQQRAIFWFGYAGYGDDDSRIDDPEWEPLATAWEQTTEYIAEYIASIASVDYSGFGDYGEMDKANANALCDMFAIPLDVITTKSIDIMTGTTDSRDEADNSISGDDIVSAFAEPFTDSNDVLYLDHVPETPAPALAPVDLVPIEAETLT